MSCCESNNINVLHYQSISGFLDSRKIVLMLVLVLILFLLGNDESLDEENPKNFVYLVTIVVLFQKSFGDPDLTHKLPPFTSHFLRKM